MSQLGSKTWSLKEFDWGTGETSRRSSRISGKAKAAESEPPAKRSRKSSASKKDVKHKEETEAAKDENDVDVIFYVIYKDNTKGGDHYKERVCSEISKSHPGGPEITSLTGERAKLQEDPQGSAERQRQAESEPQSKTKRENLRTSKKDVKHKEETEAAKDENDVDVIFYVIYKDNTNFCTRQEGLRREMRLYFLHQRGGDHYKERVAKQYIEVTPGGPAITSLAGERAKLQEVPQGSAERQRQRESEPPKQNEARKS
ncbi:hypothetical protein RND71_009438 [Anisodus tanguticus]|uniref:Uncharacterized protein n=1 Tax=Anisodus tanguticus TaxID=243964 RepID=A0AAE1SIF1_9SOLA|nr:hypothetical protein RND71_009438 [Anisodus tanguticus]